MPKLNPGDSAKNPVALAIVEVLGGTGIRELQVRYDDEQEPIVWVACGRWGDTYEAAGGMTPLKALLRLAEAAMDGGVCAYCAKPSAIVADWESPTPLNDLVCWWIYDPETKKFRRNCEAEHKVKMIKAPRPIGRNDPCPCGSGKKFKKCHGPYMGGQESKAEE